MTSSNKTNETFSVFSVFCKFFILKLQKNSKTGGTENEQEDAWIKKTRRIVLVSILCPILCKKKISYCKEHFSLNYCCLFFILSFFFSLSPFSVLKLSTIARTYFFFMIFINFFFICSSQFCKQRQKYFLSTSQCLFFFFFRSFFWFISFILCNSFIRSR